MAQIQLTAAAMEDKKGQLTTLLAQFRDELDTLSQIVSQLKNEWEGDASEAFQAAYQKKRQRFEMAAQAIQKYIDVLGRIIDQYKTTESLNTQIAGK